MTKLQQLRQRLTVVIAVLFLVDLALGIYLLWPGGSSAKDHARESALQQEARDKTRQVAPLRGIDGKLAQSRTDLSTLYRNQLPSKYSQISDEIYKLASENGVSLPALSYKADSTELPDVDRVRLETTISADYSKIPRFINAMERDKQLLMVIDQISVNGQQSGQVTLSIRFEAFLKKPA
jgi:Tfp pilus assembly protein PilO